MARTWWEIQVELVGGRGEYLWPRPARTLIARPGWTFRMLADAINTAFARWELSHLHAFTLADGSTIGIVDEWNELGFEDDTTTKLTRLSPGATFAFTFDFGDGWDHICRVGERKVDPLETAGVIPDEPIPIFGWGSIPDQHGRRFAEDTWDQPPPPPAPDPPASDLPPVLPDWGPREPARPRAPADLATAAIALLPVRDWTRDALKDLRSAVARGDGAAAVALLSVFDAADVAHHAWPVLEALAAEPDRWSTDRDILGWVTDRLSERAFDGDLELVDALTGTAPRELRAVTVDLEDLALALAGSATADFSQTLDARSGAITFVEMDAELDELLEDPVQILISSAGRNEGWWDMSEFIGHVEDGVAAEQLDRAIHGKGAFRRFADIIHRYDDDRLLTRWTLFRDERQLGRARAWLAAHGLRPQPREAQGS